MTHISVLTEKRISVSSSYLAVIAIVLSLLSICLGIPSLAAILAISSIIWGADTVRRIASYGLGTGVPSIGNLSVSIGILSSLVGLKYSPILGVLIAAATGFIFGVIISRLKILKIPHFPRLITELSLAGYLTLTCLVVGVAKTDLLPMVFNGFLNDDVVKALFWTGFIAAIYWASTLAIFHPFNAGLGADERQGRTLRIATVTSGVTICLSGIVRLGNAGILGRPWMVNEAIIMIAIGGLIWIYGLISLYNACRREAASTLWTGIPGRGGLE
ncbi:MAG: tetrahydromethanopterin S-methyltransferase subunit C [Candidatus Methanomethylicia archaeon]